MRLPGSDSTVIVTPVAASKFDRVEGVVAGPKTAPLEAVQLSRGEPKLSKEVADPGPSVFHIRKIEALLLRYRGNLSEAAHQLDALQGEERQRGNLQNLIEVDCHLAETVLESHILSGSAEVEAWDEAERMLLEARKISGGGIGRKIWPCCLLSMIQSYKGNIEAAGQG